MRGTGTNLSTRQQFYCSYSGYGLYDEIQAPKQCRYATTAEFLVSRSTFTSSTAGSGGVVFLSVCSTGCRDQKTANRSTFDATSCKFEASTVSNMLVNTHVLRHGSEGMRITRAPGMRIDMHAGLHIGVCMHAYRHMCRPVKATVALSSSRAEVKLICRTAPSLVAHREEREVPCSREQEQR